MSSKGDLFRHDPLPIYLKNRDQLILNMVGRIDSISELDQRAAEIIDGPAITRVLMHRGRATFATSRSTEGLEVNVTVPLGYRSHGRCGSAGGRRSEAADEWSDSVRAS
jgi:hypothetical protein